MSAPRVSESWKVARKSAGVKEHVLKRDDNMGTYLSSETGQTVFQLEDGVPIEECAPKGSSSVSFSRRRGVDCQPFQLLGQLGGHLGALLREIAERGAGLGNGRVGEQQSGLFLGIRSNDAEVGVGLGQAVGRLNHVSDLGSPSQGDVDKLSDGGGGTKNGESLSHDQ
jgi:hypothetical protein